MAKDGTNRGGGRSGSGKKQNSKIQRILDGAQARSLNPYDSDLEESEERSAIPDLPLWATREQKGSLSCGGESVEIPTLRIKEIYSYVWNFLNSLDVVNFVSLELIQLYSLAAARFIQCEEIISITGLTAAHPTTGAATTSPYVTASLNYLKSANALWFQISQIVKDRWEGETVFYNSSTKRSDMMEYLLAHGPGN